MPNGGFADGQFFDMGCGYGHCPAPCVVGCVAAQAFFSRRVSAISLKSRVFRGFAKRVVSKRVVSADVPPEREPERGYVRQNHPFGNRPFISQ